VILHGDLDAFYAAVAQRDDPSLRCKPLVVAGSSRRAVVLILIVDDASRRLAELDHEIGEDAVRTDAHFKAATLKPTSEKTGEDDGYQPAKAIVDYAQALDRLQRALADLQQELTRPLQARSWHTLLHWRHGRI